MKFRGQQAQKQERNAKLQVEFCEVSGILCEVFFSNKLDIMVVFFPGGDVLQRYSELEIY
jgi:hypothetical protein